MKQIIPYLWVTITLVSCSTLQQDISHPYPDTPETVLAELAAAKTESEFLKYCTEFSIRYIKDPDLDRDIHVTFKSLKAHIPQKYTIIQKRNMTEWYYLRYAKKEIPFYPNIENTLNSAIVLKISFNEKEREESQQTILHYAFIKEYGYWKFDYILSFFYLSAECLIF